MDRIVVTSRVGKDGVLHLALPMGPAAANQEVHVTVEPVPPTQEEWRRLVLGTAGQWQGEFERPAQGQLEERETLP
jgi:hypothetical protein